MRPLRSLVTFVLLAFVAAISAAADEGHPVVSSLMVPLDGIVFNSPAGEAVALTGRMHLVTQIHPTDPIDPCHVFTNLADVTGVGLSSGARYIAIGAVNLPCVPPNPIRATFGLLQIGTPPNPIMPISFDIGLAFDANGRLTSDTTVQLACTSVDFCQ